jgi:hypothetical protein
MGGGPKLPLPPPLAESFHKPATWAPQIKHALRPVTHPDSSPFLGWLHSLGTCTSIPRPPPRSLTCTAGNVQQRVAADLHLAKGVVDTIHCTPSAQNPLGLARAHPRHPCAHRVDPHLCTERSSVLQAAQVNTRRGPR